MIFIWLSQLLTLPFFLGDHTVWAAAADGFPHQQFPLRPHRVPPFAHITLGDRTGWTATADSFQPGHEPQNVLDDKPDTIWHTQWQPTNAPLPHHIIIDMKTPRRVYKVRYLTRQDFSQNGNIAQHEIYLSNDGVNFGDAVAIGTYQNDREDLQIRTSFFFARIARFVKIVILTEANGNQWASAAEIDVVSAPPDAVESSTNPADFGLWDPTIDLPLVPVAIALLPNRFDVLMWSSYKDRAFLRVAGAQTVTAIYSPTSKTITQRIVSNTDHDMFCPGISMDLNGNIVVSGGKSSARTSIYDPRSDSWTSSTDMNIGRGYQSQCTLSDGRIFVIGGSWSGDINKEKNGEIYDPNARTWRNLPRCPISPMLTKEMNGGRFYRSDNHGWLFAWKEGSVFQAGPSQQMNWYGTIGDGDHLNSRKRTDDTDAMCGNAVMYDASAGKILTVGGSENYDVGPPATANAHVITLGAAFKDVGVTRINRMWFQRTFHNSVVLPDGQVFITGGQINPHPFNDESAILVSELWSPVDTQFRRMAPHPIPRTYHSVAILLHDATVWTGGGGLCGGCSESNHFDAQVFNPPYLFNRDGSRATRPRIVESPAKAFVGQTIVFKTDSTVASFSLIRFGATTHTVNTDQRRIPLKPRKIDTNNYGVDLPADPGILIKGPYLLFALNDKGTPSVGVQIIIN